MIQYSNTRKEHAVRIKSATENLSEVIEQTVEKQPDEEVRSVRVFGDRYRCNWWVRDQASHTTFSVASGRIRRSNFLRAIRSGDKVVIQDLTGH